MNKCDQRSQIWSFIPSNLLVLGIWNLQTRTWCTRSTCILLLLMLSFIKNPQQALMNQLIQFHYHQLCFWFSFIYVDSI